jgi:hypothetical protein
MLMVNPSVAWPSRAETAEVRREINAGVRGMWVTEKAKRIAKLQQIYEEALQHLEALEDVAQEAGELVNGHEWRGYAREQIKILREIGEQMGQIPSRPSAEGPPLITLRHEVVGVDLQAALLGPQLELPRGPVTYTTRAEQSSAVIIEQAEEDPTAPEVSTAEHTPAPAPRARTGAEIQAAKSGDVGAMVTKWAPLRSARSRHLLIGRGSQFSTPTANQPEIERR